MKLELLTEEVGGSGTDDFIACFTEMDEVGNVIVRPIAVIEPTETEGVETWDAIVLSPLYLHIHVSTHGILVGGVGLPTALAEVETWHGGE